MKYHNYIRIIEDLYKLREENSDEYRDTLNDMIDEAMYNFLEFYNVPPEKRECFLKTMFKCPMIINENKAKKFDM